MRNGQNVLVYAPRRYGKSSLVLRAAQEAMRKGVLVGYCDLMRTPTKERFAAALAKTIYSDIAPPLDQAFERAAEPLPRPADHADDGGRPERRLAALQLPAGRRKADIDDTIERLLELPGELAAERKRRVVLVFDEFQEVVALDRRFPNLMRAVFQAQPEVAHVYLGSKRHVLERDLQRPRTSRSGAARSGSRSGRSRRRSSRASSASASRRPARASTTRRSSACSRRPAATRTATQELAYFVWELVPTGRVAGLADVEAALAQACCAPSTTTSRKLWDDAPHAQRLLMLALAEEPRARSTPPATPSGTTSRRTRRSSGRIGALVAKEIAGRDEDGAYRIVEPFFAEWLRSEQEALGAQGRAPRLALSGWLGYGQDALLAQMRRGTLQYCVLAPLASEERYGFDLVRGLADVDGMVTSEGTIYPLLTRLRRDGLVESSWRESSSGPPRRYYRPDGCGQAALEDFRREWSRFRDAVDTSWKEGHDHDDR